MIDFYHHTVPAISLPLVFAAAITPNINIGMIIGTVLAAMVMWIIKRPVVTPTVCYENRTAMGRKIECTEIEVKRLSETLLPFMERLDERTAQIQAAQDRMLHKMDKQGERISALEGELHANVNQE